MLERTYRIHVAAEMSGVSEGLIRAWERRYGVLKPRRSASGYRAYTDDDIDVLKRLKQLTEEGVSISDAVALLPQIRRELKETAGAPVLRRAPQAEQFVRWREAVVAAGERLDQDAVDRILLEASSSLPPVVFFEEVAAPVQRMIGDRWHAGIITVAEEHLVTQAVRQRLLTLLNEAPRRARRHVVCACLPYEDHEVGLLGVALRFRHAGWRVTYLGARTPNEHLTRVVRAVRPDLVALSVVNDLGRKELKKALQAVIATLPEGTSIAVGGAAAHASVVAELELKAANSAEEWVELVA